MTEVRDANPLRSAVWNAAYERAAKAAEDMRKPLDEQTLTAIADEAEARNVYGDDAKKDAKGNFIQQGIGAKGRETSNHFAALLRYEGPVVYQKALREIWGRDPARAKLINLPEPERLGA